MLSRNYYIDVKYKIKLYDVNVNKNLTPTSLFRTLQETAGEHHFAAQNSSLLDSYLQGFSWILVQAKFKFLEIPKYQQTIIIRTWLSEIRSIKAIREYEIYDETGKLLGFAKKSWAFFDVHKLRPAPMPKGVYDNWPTNPKTNIEFNKNLLADNFNIAYSTQIKVRKSDLDYNQHVNNIYYVQWMREIIPEELNNNAVVEMESKFLAESKFGDTLNIYRSDIYEDGTFDYEIFNESSNKKCFRAKVKIEM